MARFNKMTELQNTNILKLINEEKYNYENKRIQIVPNFLFNQKETIETIYFYYNSKFQTGDIDIEGDKKYFFNIVKNPCEVHTKAIDFDTKDIRILTADGGNPAKTWYFERDLKQWMKNQNFGKVLNRIFKELPIFGSVVIKIINNNLYFVDLRNFIVEQSADTLSGANYIIEKHPYTVMNFRKAMKDLAIDKSKIEEAVKLYRETPDAKHLMVYERYGEVEDNKGNWSYRRVYIADVGKDESDQAGMVIPHKGIELKSEEIEKHPYWEFHLNKIPGRWLGVGVVELLFDPQIRENELVNVQAKATYARGMILFQTLDPNYNKNLKKDAENFQVLGVDQLIQEIPIPDRNLAYFNEETKKWLANRDELTLSYDVIQGERLPAGTPLGSAQIAATMSLSYFDQIRENIALDIKEMLYDVIIPNFQKQSTAEHSLRLIGEDLDTYVQMIKGIKINEEIVKLAIKSMTGRNPFPTESDKEVVGIAVEGTMKEGKEMLLPIPKNFYSDVKYQIEIEITGESKDTRVYTATLFGGLQAITADPTILEDPIKRKFFSKYLESGGVRMEDFMGQIKPQLEQTLEKRKAGGGVSRPVMPNNPVMAEMPQIK